MQTIIITAGGTVEPIDDVRAVTNFSTGSVGLALAQEACERGLAVELLLGKLAQGAPHPNAKVTRFGSAQNLSDLLLPLVHSCAASGRAVVFHSAAVADYAPVPVAGKISSDRDELTLTLRKTPKIIDQIKPEGAHGIWLTSFKLLSKKDGRDVKEVAKAQMKRTRSDCVVANYTEDVTPPHYTGWVLLASGAEREVRSRSELAKIALDVALRHIPASRE